MLQYVIFPKKKTFINEVKALNKGEPADSVLIWNGFQGTYSQQNISYFCLQIFQHVLQSEKKFYLPQNQQRIYATLLCIQVLKNKKQKSKQTIEQCKIFIQKLKPCHGKALLHFLFRQNKDYGFPEFFMSSLAMLPISVDETQDIGSQIKTQIRHVQEFKEKSRITYSQKAYQMLKIGSFPKIYMNQSKILAFGYFCLTEIIKNNNNMIKRNEYQHLRNVLRYLMDGAKSVSLSQYLLKYIHLTTKLITYYGCFQEDIIKDLIICADKLRQFPLPIGQQANYLFNILFEELKLPGSAFRKKLRKDFLSLDSKDSRFLNKQFYLITDNEDLYNHHEDMSLIILRKMFILHVLKIVGISQKIFESFKIVLKYLDQSSTYLLYEKITKIMELVRTIQTYSKIKEILQQYVPKLFNEAKQKYQKGPQKATSVEVQQFQISMKKINRFGFFQYPSYQIISVPIDHFTSNKDKVFNIFKIINKKKTDYQAKPHHKIKIPLVYNGTNQSFTKFVKAITEYQENFNTQGLRFQIYFLPRHDNNVLLGLGSYISSKDPWYYNFIYNIYEQKTLYPHIDAYKSGKDLFPYYLYRKNLQLYLRQAKHSIMLQVYRCTIKRQQKQQEQVVYMASFCMMGLFCQAKIIKMNKQKQKGKQQRYQNKQLIDVINEKIKKTTVMTLNLQISCVQPLTNIVRNKKEQNIRVQDLQICNISHDYFMGKCPNSSSPTLQMTILTETNGKILRKQIGKSQNYKQNRSLNEIHSAFRDLFICRSIKSIKISNGSLGKSEGLKILIDGRVMGGIQRIQIEAAVSLNENLITLPIRCFLPPL